MSDLAQGVAVAAVAIGWGAGAVPPGAAVAVTIVAVFNTAAVRGPVRPAVVIGVQQTLFGLAVVGITAVAVHL